MIKVTVKEGLLMVTSPYNKEFVSFARMRGGKWSDAKKVWIFDPRDEFAVRSALIDIFGTDDYESCPKVSVRVKLDGFKVKQEFVLFGLRLLVRRYSDRYVDIHPNVVVVSGGFAPDGGHWKYPEILPEKGTVIEVRDIPRDIALRVWSESTEHVELLGSVNLEALKEEKRALLARIDEIDRMLAELEIESERDDLADLYDDPDGPSGESS